ncbi:MAG: peptidoglycan-binding protein [Theionarchaea archaeon]|nr:peptidoglycan-binding protein [Theionarchaea archaeon]MBU7038638.1 peptidoglycan-binding protein [Theionarchaea archaeon]
MKKLREKLAKKFAPTYIASEGERCYLTELRQKEKPQVALAYPVWNPHVYFSALNLGSHRGKTAFEINYLTIWDWDTGGVLGRISGHQWDTERTAVLVVGPVNSKDPEEFSVHEAYYAAHEGVPLVDKSSYVPCARKDCGVTVYWSLGKHASYAEPPQGILGFERFRSPGIRTEPEDCTLTAVGTTESPLPEAPWIIYKKGWGTSRITPVYRKLRTRLWKRSSWQKIKEPSTTEEHIKLFQEYRGLEPTGKVDRETFSQARHIDPLLIENITQLSQEKFEVLNTSHVSGKDIDLLVKSELTASQIKKVATERTPGAIKARIKKYGAE